MKKVLVAACLMFGGASLVNAQQQTPAQQQGQTQTMDQDQDKQQIAASELPASVTAKLESQDYSGWTVGNVYKKSDESQNEIYVVEMKSGVETKKVKFDRDGNQIEDKDHMNKDKEHADKSNYRDEAEASEEMESDDASSQSADETESSETETETETESADNADREEQQ